MSEIAVTTVDVERLASRFDVRVTDDDGSSTEHDVTLSSADHEPLGVRYRDPETFIYACSCSCSPGSRKDRSFGHST